MIQERDEDDGYLPPFPDSVMIQLAKGVTATNFALDDPDLLSEDFSYIEPLMGPMDKEKYLDVFEKFNVRDAVPDLDYQFQVRLMTAICATILLALILHLTIYLYMRNRTTELTHMIRIECGLTRGHAEREQVLLVIVLPPLRQSTWLLRKACH